MNLLIQDIIETALSKNENENENVIRNLNLATNKKNQALLIVKPEVFFNPNKDSLIDFFELLFELFEYYLIEIAGVVLFSCDRFMKTKVIKRHFRFINSISTNSSQTINKIDKKKIYDAFDLEFDSVPLLGGHEYIKTFQITEDLLEEIWSHKKAKKIKSGLYAQYQVCKNEKTIILNGFHPSQLLNYTGPKNKILAFLINSDTPWSIIKKEVVGNSFPEKSTEGSIRQLLYRNYKKWGLKRIDVSRTGVHFPSGPFEALYEINNLFSIVRGFDYNLNSTKLAVMLRNKGYGRCHIEKFMENPKITINNMDYSLFEITENIDTDTSIDILKKYFKIED